jgi:hypothetical protein
MSVEHERLTIPMDLELKWTKEKLLERDKQISKLIAENSRLRDSKLLEEDIREGISLRDHFAGLAMQSLYLSNTRWEATGEERDEESVALIKELACDAYHLADAMIAERNKND